MQGEVCSVCLKVAESQLSAIWRLEVGIMHNLISLIPDQAQRSANKALQSFIKETCNLWISLGSLKPTLEKLIAEASTVGPKRETVAYIKVTVWAFLLQKLRSKLLLLLLNKYTNALGLQLLPLFPSAYRHHTLDNNLSVSVRMQSQIVAESYH
ncbi:hypothetical protein M440DRAFT_306795 [Trichoderma longibrachiatum ATCC 18648]|uniref:Uncharacterized protein n=1 Tax=Trichoderma longibrachiatum ATCC 18648 TaxID=983965 RepID=A0A2T4C5S0_TRILO|nr:hypothetical protein M440DRAFT_306795 [Trichoderma longibrachiatum ATCC 18648]